MSEHIDEDYTIFLSSEAEENLAAYICSTCGGEMTPQDDEENVLYAAAAAGPNRSISMTSV